MSETQRRIHPVVATAAVAVIIFSALGIGVITGVIPTSKSREAPAPIAATEAPATRLAPAPAVEPVERPAPPAAEPSPAPKPAPAKQTPRATRPSPPGQESAPGSAALPAESQASAPPVPVAKAPAVCKDCGIIDSVQVSEQQGEGTGLGAVAGGVAGGLLGSQIGGGSGKTIATIAGVAAGAYGGHQVEKHVKSTRQWNVRVFMDDGSTRTITETTEPMFKPGDRVRVVDGKLMAR